MAEPLAPQARRQVLDALGLTPLRFAPPGAPARASAPDAAPALTPDAALPRTAAAAEAVAATATATATATAPAASAAAVSEMPIDPLWRALLRAAGCAEQADVVPGLRRVTQGPAFSYVQDELQIHCDALRGDPAAKRTLWRTLRVLRRRALARG